MSSGKKQAFFKRVWPAAITGFGHWTISTYTSADRDVPGSQGPLETGHPCKVRLGYKPGKAGLTITALSEPY